MTGLVLCIAMSINACYFEILDKAVNPFINESSSTQTRIRAFSL